MDRATSLRILGLLPSATRDEIVAAYGRLRAHVEARAQAAATDAQRRAREEELLLLEESAAALTAAPFESKKSKLGLGRDSWVLIWASLGTVVALVLGVQLWVRASGGPPVLVERAGGEGAGGGSGEGQELGADRARLVANAGVAGASLEIDETESGARVAAGPADETIYWLAPGPYTLRVRHGDCEDRWEQSLEVAAGADLALVPQVCADTGWLVVHANVDGARVSVDDRAVGLAGPARHPLRPGEREVRVEKDGYAPWRGIAQLEAGRELSLKPRLEPEAPPQAKPPSPAPASAPAPAPAVVPASAQLREGDDNEGGGAGPEPVTEKAGEWHHDTRQWILARYDVDQSGSIDTAEELEAIPCDYWVGIERSYDVGGLGVPLIRFYSFDGEGWKAGSLGVGSEIRDLAFRRMKDCGLRY